MKVIYELPDGNWTGMGNDVVRTWRLTVRARGLLMILISYPENNDITIAKLAEMGKKARKQGLPAEGREALQVAMRELEREGFVVHARQRDKDTGQWSTQTYVSSFPEAIAQYATPKTALPRSGNPFSGSQSSADPHSEDQRLSTYKTNEKSGDKTSGQEGGLQDFSSLASAREGQHAGEQDRAEAALHAMYEAVRQTTETHLRDRLLRFERKRPAIYRKYRIASIAQIENEEHPKRLAEVGSSRLIDELTMMYAIRHYAKARTGVPQWLIRFPLRSVS